MMVSKVAMDISIPFWNDVLRFGRADMVKKVHEGQVSYPEEKQTLTVLINSPFDGA
jgi:hypothetical protein